MRSQQSTQEMTEGMRRQRLGVLYWIGLCFLLAVLSFVGFTTRPVEAQPYHAFLVRSDPAQDSVLGKAPVVIRLWFSEPVQFVGQAITIYAPSGAQIQYGSTQVSNLQLMRPVNAASPGTYLVVWQVISQDTVAVSGHFVFSIGQRGGIWAGTMSSGVSKLGVGLQALARFLHFLGYALGFGALAFLRLLLFPLGLDHEKPVWRRLWAVVSSGILLLLLAECVAVLAQMASLGASDLFTVDILGDVLASSFGRVLALRLAAAILLWVCAGIAEQFPKHGVTAALGLGLLLACIDGETSHVVTSRMPWPALIASVLHIVAMGVWIGGLVALVVLWGLKPLRSQGHIIVKRFALLALASLVELLCTGLFMAWLLLPSPSNLFGTPYGRVLLIKLTALLLPLLFVWISQRVPLDQRRRWWILETLGLISILGLAGLSPSRPFFERKSKTSLCCRFWSFLAF